MGDPTINKHLTYLLKNGKPWNFAFSFLLMWKTHTSVLISKYLSLCLFVWCVWMCTHPALIPKPLSPICVYVFKYTCMYIHTHSFVSADFQKSFMKFTCVVLTIVKSFSLLNSIPLYKPSTIWPFYLWWTFGSFPFGLIFLTDLNN